MNVFKSVFKKQTQMQNWRLSWCSAGVNSEFIVGVSTRGVSFCARMETNLAGDVIMPREN